ncbi:MAG: tyrosine-type recombinase/integrase [Candidatus Margulisbacteria bacterium]|nr:tyrosine-type recombinase/integrase [Candidatus Margulisiibacteriota bacterium]
MEDYLSKVEIKALLKAVTNTRDYAITTLLLTTGISRGELCALTTDNINLEKEILTVLGNKPRTIPINPQAKDAVARWLSERPAAKTDILFLTNKGTLQGLSPRSVDHLLRKGGQEAGINVPVTTQLLRSTYAVNLFQDGATVKQASELLGISDYNTLHKYQKLADGQETVAAETQSTKEQPVSQVETRPKINQIISDVFPVKPKPVKKLSNLQIELRPDPAEVIFGRDHLIKEIRAMLNKGQSVLLEGKFGVGKTHILKHMAHILNIDKVPSSSKRGDLGVSYFESPAQTKTILHELCEKLGATEFKSTTQVQELLDYALRNKDHKAPVLIIDNLDKIRAGDIEVLIKIVENFTVLSATEEPTPKLKALWYKFKEIKVNPLNPDHCKELIKYLTQNMSISDYDLMETRLLNQSNCLPLAIVDMAVQLSHANVVTREVVRDVHHEIGVVYRDWSYAVILLWAVLVLFRFIALGTHSFEGYILAGIGMSMIVVIRFFVFKGR